MPPRSEPAGGAAGEPGGGSEGRDGKGGTGRPCPICGKPAQQATQPFCSKRCRDVDLNRWFSGSYVVPGTEAEDDGSE